MSDFAEAARLRQTSQLVRDRWGSQAGQLNVIEIIIRFRPPAVLHLLAKFLILQKHFRVTLLKKDEPHFCQLMIRTQKVFDRI